MTENGLLFAILSILAVPVLSLPPFWPEENCFNAYSLGHDDLAQPGEPIASAVNPFSSRFDAHPYAQSKMAGPLLNTSTPCRIKAHVGQPLSFNVYAEDLDAGDTVRIYVLEDPGIPNGARVLPDSQYQRCMPTNAGPFIEGGPDNNLGVCPMCQDFGMATFGLELVPESPGLILDEWVRNQTRQSIHPRDRVWCLDSNAEVGFGKLEAAAERGRLMARQFVWTPLPEQGVCGGMSETCLYVVKFQAFDAAGENSVIKTIEIEVHKAAPSYAHGTYGLIEGAERGLKTDPVTGDQDLVGLTELQTMPQWMTDGETYPAYVYCPMEFALGAHGGQYKVAMEDTSPAAPPGYAVEWRAWDRACSDLQPEGPMAHWDAGAYTGGFWSDGEGQTCGDYEERGWCDGGMALLGEAELRARARGGWVAANDACCVCGGGAKAACSGSAGEAACEEPLAAAPGVAVSRTRGCGWDTKRCVGRAMSFAVTAGAYEGAWRVEAEAPLANRVVAVLRWTPERGMEGSEHVVCFRAADEFQMRPLEATCVRLRVAKCRYCARVGETLKYIAEHYNHDTNWLRLWNYNPDITDPDQIIRSFLPVTIGSTYRVQPGDSLSRIAARMRTTVKKILEVNPDMTSTDIDADQELCVMPCTLNPIVGSGVHGYVPEAINGIPQGFQEPIPRFSHDPPFHQRPM